MRIRLARRQHQLLTLAQRVETLDELATLFGLEFTATRKQLYRLVEKKVMVKTSVKPDGHSVECPGKGRMEYYYRDHSVEITTDAIPKEYVETVVKGREPPLKPAPPDLVKRALSSRTPLEQVW
jgi:predicted ArsR family transcriptional regulator